MVFNVHIKIYNEQFLHANVAEYGVS